MAYFQASNCSPSDDTVAGHLPATSSLPCSTSTTGRALLANTSSSGAPPTSSQSASPQYPAGTPLRPSPFTQRAHEYDAYTGQLRAGAAAVDGAACDAMATDLDPAPNSEQPGPDSMPAGGGQGLQVPLRSSVTLPPQESELAALALSEAQPYKDSSTPGSSAARSEALIDVEATERVHMETDSAERAVSHNFQEGNAPLDPPYASPRRTSFSGMVRSSASAPQLIPSLRRGQVTPGRTCRSMPPSVHQALQIDGPLCSLEWEEVFNAAGAGLAWSSMWGSDGGESSATVTAQHPQHAENGQCKDQHEDLSQRQAGSFPLQLHIPASDGDGRREGISGSGGRRWVGSGGEREGGAAGEGGSAARLSNDQQDAGYEEWTISPSDSEICNREDCTDWQLGASNFEKGA